MRFPVFSAALPVNPVFSAMPSSKKPPKVRYTALFLPPDNPLVQMPIPSGWQRHAHHVTLQYKPTPPVLPFVNGQPITGQLVVEDIRQTPQVLFAVVSPPQLVKDWLNAHAIEEPLWHITIATAPGVEPVAARHALAQALGQSVVLPGVPVTLPFTSGWSRGGQDARFEPLSGSA